MKKYNLMAVMLLLCSIVWSQNDQEPTLTQDDLQQLFTMNDSVIREGMHLYLYEKLSWQAADNYFATGADAQGSFIIEDDTTMHILFVDNNLQSVYEEVLNLKTYETWKSKDVRKLTDEEAQLWQRQVRLIEKTGEVQLPLRAFPEGTAAFNLDVIRINADLTRVYIIMGALAENLIPFGNDFSLDFDNNDSLVAQRAYHHSYIPITWEKGSKPSRVVHSHTRDNPYITPTDICTFMLYGRDLYGLKDLWVYSPALHSYLVFCSDLMTIITSTSATIDTPSVPTGKKGKKGKKEKKR